MKVLKFEVSGQSLVPVSIPKDAVAGSKGYLKCQFDATDNAWIGCVLIAEFNDDEAVIVRNGLCDIPDKYSRRSIFKVRLHGIRGSSYQIVTNNVIVKL